MGYLNGHCKNDRRKNADNVVWVRKSRLSPTSPQQLFQLEYIEKMYGTSFVIILTLSVIENERRWKTSGQAENKRKGNRGWESGQGHWFYFQCTFVHMFYGFHSSQLANWIWKERTKFCAHNFLWLFSSSHSSSTQMLQLPALILICFVLTFSRHFVNLVTRLSWIIFPRVLHIFIYHYFWVLLKLHSL